MRTNLILFITVLLAPLPAFAAVELPEPMSMSLLGLGVMGTVALLRRRK